MTVFVIKVQRSGVWWAFDAAMFPVAAILHFTNFVELIYNSQPYSEVGAVIYIGCSTLQVTFLDSRLMPCTLFFPTRKTYPKDVNNFPLARNLKQTFFLRLPEVQGQVHNLRSNYMRERRKSKEKILGNEATVKGR